MLKIVAGFCALALSSVALAATTTLEAPNGRVRLQVSVGSSPAETVSIQIGGKWVRALISPQAATRVVTLGTPEVPHACTIQTADPIPDGLLARGDCGVGHFEQRVTLTPEPDVLAVTVKFVHSSGVKINSVEDRYSFAPGRRSGNDPAGPVDLVWSQNIKNEADGDIPQGAFKPPVVMLQQGPVFAALMPKLSERHSDPLALDLDVTSQKLPWLAYGAIPSQPYGHSYSRRSKTGSPEIIPVATRTRQHGVVTYGGEGVVEYRYFIVASDQPHKLGYRRAVRLLWQLQGHPELMRSDGLQRNVLRPRLVTFQDWSKDTWVRYADDVYFGADCGRRRCGTLADHHNPSAPWNRDPGPDAWFNPWFQTLRSAYGWYLYGRSTGNTAVERKAESVLNLILTSPRDGGTFPTIYLFKDKRWVRFGYKDTYSAFAMSWTGYWMLQWGKNLTPSREPEILTFLRPYGDFLVKHQLASGVIPAWYHGNLEPLSEFRDFNAGATASSSLFLAALYRATGDRRYLDAAEKAIGFVTREVLPRQKWFDFETFLSCARKPFDFYDAWTAQYPQNNLSQIQAADAYLEIYDITHKPQYLTVGTRVLDYLLLTQQVWNNPALSPKLVGGFTTQNTDTEWSDAREAYAAMTLWNYYKATGKQEYLERAMGAARATFAVAPWENWAHMGYDNESGAWTGFNWGAGSGMTSIEMLAPKLGDAYIDLSNGTGVCFNACSFQHLKLSGRDIYFGLQTIPSLRTVHVKFAGANKTGQYRIHWNGNESASMNGANLMRDGYTIHR